LRTPRFQVVWAGPQSGPSQAGQGPGRLTRQPRRDRCLSRRTPPERARNRDAVTGGRRAVGSPCDDVGHETACFPQCGRRPQPQGSTLAGRNAGRSAASARCTEGPGRARRGRPSGRGRARRRRGSQSTGRLVPRSPRAPRTRPGANPAPGRPRRRFTAIQPRSTNRGKGPDTLPPTGVRAQSRAASAPVAAGGGRTARRDLCGGASTLNGEPHQLTRWSGESAGRAVQYCESPGSTTPGARTGRNGPEEDSGGRAKHEASSRGITRTTLRRCAAFTQQGVHPRCRFNVDL